MRWNHCNNMDGLRDDLTKWSKSGRERQIPYNTYMVNTYMWNLKYDTNEPIYEIGADSQT